MEMGKCGAQICDDPTLRERMETLRFGKARGDRKQRKDGGGEAALSRS